MRIKKVSQSIPIKAKVVNSYSESEEETYSCDYVNEHSIVVSPTEPTGNDRRKVWFQKGKNLFEGILSKGGINVSTGSNNDGLSSIRSNYIKVNSNTVYTLSSVNNYNNYIIFYNKNYEYIDYYEKGNIINTFTTPTDCSYIRFATYSSLNVTDITSKFQLEQNSKATTYEAYIEPQIFVRNSNGVYEEFTKNDNVILYNNVNGSNEDITLNDNSNNYKYIDIYYTQQDGTYSFVRALPNTTVALSAPHVTDKGYAIAWSVRNIKISGNKITTDTTNRYLFINVVSTNSLTGASKTNNVYITKVVGYK